VVFFIGLGALAVWWPFARAFLNSTPQLNVVLLVAVAVVALVSIFLEAAAQAAPWGKIDFGQRLAWRIAMSGGLSISATGVLVTGYAALMGVWYGMAGFAYWISVPVIPLALGLLVVGTVTHLVIAGACAIFRRGTWDSFLSWIKFGHVQASAEMPPQD
jgi:hypothetical protein